MEEMKEEEEVGMRRILLEKKGLRISFSPEKGRCLISDKDFSPGEVIITQLEPYVSFPDTCSIAKICQVCFSPASATPLKKCSVCKMAWYCSYECQRAEWKLHQHECRCLMRLSNERRKMLTPSMHLIIRILIRRRLQIDKVIDVTPFDNYGLVEQLVSHMPEIDEKQLVTYAQMANLVKLILPLEDISIKEITQNFSRLACNAHTICDSELRPLGTGLYTVISIINHSCLPNSVLLFEGKSAVVRATEYVKRGSEVVISYIETAASTSTRQKTLKEQYLFRCMCVRCMRVGLMDDLQEAAALEGCRCINENCEGLLLPASDGQLFICQLCGLSRKTKDISRSAAEIDAKLHEAARVFSSGNFVEALAAYKEVEQLQRMLCHSLSIKLMRTREALMKIFMALENWMEALEQCHLTMPVYERAYPGNHPLMGLQYYTCGKLEWSLGETTDAVCSLTKALDILRVTHGTSVPLVRELTGLVEEARAEQNWQLHSSSRS